MNEGVAVRTRLTLGGLASAGVVAAHVLGFWLATPDAHERDLLLRSTGHRYWALVVAVALGVLVAGLAHTIRRTWRSMRPPEPGPLFLSSVLRLLGLQAGGFLVLELVERLSAAPSAIHLGQKAVVIGLALQLFVAILGATLLVLVVKTVEVVARSRRTAVPRRSPVLFQPIPSFIARKLEVAGGRCTPRAPPLSS